MKRGDVVVVAFPFQDKPGEKIRPALVVQCDAENGRLVNTILAMITGNLDELRAAHYRSRRSKNNRGCRIRTDGLIAGQVLQPGNR